jgi:hypothetical protein
MVLGHGDGLDVGQAESTLGQGYMAQGARSVDLVRRGLVAEPAQIELNVSGHGHPVAFWLAVTPSTALLRIACELRVLVVLEAEVGDTTRWREPVDLDLQHTIVTERACIRLGVELGTIPRRDALVTPRAEREESRVPLVGERSGLLHRSIYGPGTSRSERECEHSSRQRPASTHDL